MNSEIVEQKIITLPRHVQGHVNCRFESTMGWEPVMQKDKVIVFRPSDRYLVRQRV